MDSIPAEYLIVIYFIIALPFIVAILGAIALIVVVVLYFTNRRKTALKILKVSGVAIVLFITFAWLTKSSLGL